MSQLYQIAEGGWLFWVEGGIILWLIITTMTAFQSGLRSIPGPCIARFTDLWRLLKVAQGDFQQTIIRAHRKYGEVVRIGPRTVSISSAEAIDVIYGLRQNFPKSGFYNVIMATNKGKPVETFFTTQRINYHSALKRPIKNAYTMSTITDYEPHIDRTLLYLIQRLRSDFSLDNTTCDIGKWFHFYSFDVISQITWSEPLGLLRKGADIDALIQTLETDMDYNAPIGQIPWLDKILKKNPIYTTFLQKSSKFAEFASRKISQRREKRYWTDEERKDFMAKFLKAKVSHPNIVGDQELISFMVTNIVAGSDTTAISLRAVLYYLLKHPHCYTKLQHELDNSGLPDDDDDGIVSWADAQKLPYLDACIREAFRMHPAVGLLLERVTPREIILPSGEKIPANTIVGINAWSLHRNPRVFGDNVDQYIPERWLQGNSEDEESYQSRVKSMKRADMTFGHGTRTCLGKNIGLMETYKTVPSLLRSFRFELTDKEGQWTLKNSWFVRQSGLKVVISPRVRQ